MNAHTSAPRRRRPVWGAMLGLLALSGCAATDPFQRPGAWRPEGVNQANTAAMVARPADLLRGRGAGGTDSPLATAAVTRLWEGTPPSSAVATIGASPAAASPAAAPGGSAGASAGASGSP